MEDDRALDATDEALMSAYPRFLLRTIRSANRLGLQGVRILELQWQEDIPTGRKTLRFKCRRPR